MPARWYCVVLDANDLPRLADFWQAALGYQRSYEADDEIELTNPEGGEPGLVLVPVPEGKQAKNRLHLDLAPRPGESQDDEVARLEALGARRVDIGQGDVSWVVLADPEGNEFCVLTPR
jgi:catechol 2,3-dioxygenase-like lactoylglutathione lyase family enzyme